MQAAYWTGRVVERRANRDCWIVGVTSGTESDPTPSSGTALLESRPPRASGAARLREDGVVAFGNARPSGTVCFLFTDIEGSTRLWEQHPDEMAVAVERHDEVLREVIESRGGYVFTTAGDAFAAAFARVGDGLAAASSAQAMLGGEDWPEAVEIRVRMGVHVGGAQERDGDYFGRC